MADQNQNQIPGTLRTLKKDLDLWSSNPQDRLQQSGNFVQARPEITNNVASIPTDTPSKIAVEKKDSTLASNESNYSWSNMSTSPNVSSNTSFNPPSRAISEPKSGFSVLDDSIDLPLDTNLKNTTTSSNSNLDSNPINSQPVTSLDSKLDPSTPDNKFDINGLNLQDDIKDVKTKKTSAKALISATIVIILLGLISGGVYFYFNMSSNSSDINVTTDTDINSDDSNDTSTDIDNTTPNLGFNSPLPQDSVVDIDFIDSEPIRKTISTVLTDKKDTLIELNLTKDSNTVSLVDIADIMSITIASIGTIEGYKLYAYNQQGVYKLAAVLGLSSDQSAKTFVENWSNSIPRDLAGFSINLPSRIVNNPQIKTSTITNNSGKVFNNYYYNYTSPSDSIDVSSYENFILLASSQDSMRYILEQIK